MKKPKKKKILESCLSCGGKLTKSKVDDFGDMVFVECKPCRVIWDYVGITTDGEIGP